MVSPHEHETEPLPSSGEDSFGPLVTALGYLVRSKRTSSASYEGGKEFSASFACLVEWADANSLIRQPSDFPFFSREPDGLGDEHECWYDEKLNLWFKATYPNKFGLSWVRDGSACPLEYLQRLVYQNDFFGDEVQLEGIVKWGERIRVVTSQPHIQGEPATYEEITKWFTDLGFQRIELGGSIAWFHLGYGLLVADAHEGNVLKSDKGLFPIDLNVMRPEGEALAQIQSHLQVEVDWETKAQPQYDLP